MKQILSMILAGLMLLCFAGCSANTETVYTESAMDSSYEGGNGLLYGNTGSAPAGTAMEKTETVSPENQKLIRTMRIQAQTQELDPLLAQMESQIKQLGGYVENKSVYNGVSTANKTTRNADLVIRIPADRLDEFAQQIRGQSNVISMSESVDDVTLSYVAVESRITALETEQQRLLELMEKAETMSDLLQIEARLTEVCTELEKVVSQLRVYDNMIAYATLNLFITEVKEYTEPEVEKTVWQRIGGGLENSWEIVCAAVTEFFVFVIVSLPIVIPMVAVTLGVIFVVRLRTKRNRKNHNESDTQQNELNP